MSVNIKNARVERLLDQITAITGEGKTEAMRRALEDRHELLRRQGATSNAGARLRLLLEREIWPSIAPDLLGTRLSKAEEEAILGYGADGA